MRESSRRTRRAGWHRNARTVSVPGLQTLPHQQVNEPSEWHWIAVCPQKLLLFEGVPIPISPRNQMISPDLCTSTSHEESLDVVVLNSRSSRGKLCQPLSRLITLPESHWFQQLRWFQWSRWPYRSHASIFLFWQQSQAHVPAQKISRKLVSRVHSTNTSSLPCLERYGKYWFVRFQLTQDPGCSWLRRHLMLFLRPKG